MSKVKNRIAYRYRSKWIGVSLLIGANAVGILLMIIIGKYSALHAKYISMGLLVLVGIMISMNLVGLIGYAKNVLFFRKVLVWTSLIFLILAGVSSFYVMRVEGLIQSIFNQKQEETISLSLITIYKDETLQSLDAVGFIPNDDFGFAQEATDFIKSAFFKKDAQVDVLSYTSDAELLEALEMGELDAVVLGSSFRSAFENYNIDLVNKIDVLKSFDYTKKQDASDISVTHESFTILLAGLNDNLADSIIVATFNPEKRSVTMTSLSRDSYVPIACQAGQPKDKINHSRGIGRECLLDTVESYLDIEIDYYFEADFYALVKIVDALGGLEITSPVAFSGSLPKEDNPQEYEGVQVPAGKNLLNGKQVITFARERNHFEGSDFSRQQNQQYVIKEIVGKMLATRNPNTLIKVLEGAHKNFSSNLSVGDLTQLMGYFIKEAESSAMPISDVFRIKQSQIVGDSPIIHGSWVVDPYMVLVRDTQDMIKDNLSMDSELNRDYGFDLNYQKPYSEFLNIYELYELEGSETLSDLQHIPQFVSKADEKSVLAWGRRYDVAVNVNYVSSDQVPGSVVSQSVAPGFYGRYEISRMSIDVVKGLVESPVSDEVVPDFKKMTIDEVKSWARKHRNIVNLKIVDVDDPLINQEKVTYQDVKAGVLIDDIEDGVIVVTIAHPKKED